MSMTFSLRHDEVIPDFWIYTAYRVAMFEEYYRTVTYVKVLPFIFQRLHTELKNVKYNSCN